ncbi:hypothetical protein PMAYCL1PPCAC_28315, partial [Pristionchus mayeri]
QISHLDLAHFSHLQMQPLPSLFLLLCLLLAALLPAAAADYSMYDNLEDNQHLLQVLQRVMRRRAVPASAEQFSEFSSPAKRHARIGGTIVMGKRRR